METSIADVNKKAHEIVEARIKEEKEEKTHDSVFNPKKPKPYYARIGFIISLLLFVFSSSSTVILWGTEIYETAILKVVTLSESGLIFPIWKSSDHELTISIYPFNYTNIDNMDGMTIPHVKEVGPYVYKERVEKVNIRFNDNGTVSFSDNRTHKFDPVASKGSLDDLIYTPNVPLFSALAKGMERNGLLQLSLATVLKGLFTRVFHEVSIQDFVTGFDDSFSLFARKAVSILGEKPPKFGILNSRIGVSSDIVTMGTGLPDLDNFGVISVSNGQPALDYWSAEECNTITGADGTFFPGNIVQKSSTMYLYVKEFCRRLPLEFNGEYMELQGLPAKRFELPPDVFNNPPGNKKYNCFCDNNECPPNGTFNTAKCQFGAPIYISFPHFLHGDPALRENVRGLKPDPEKHKFYMDLHSKFGIPLGGKTRFQLNVRVHHMGEYLRDVHKIADGTILPIAWIEFSIGELGGKLLQLAHHGTYTLSYIKMALDWTSLVVLIGSSIKLFMYSYKN